MKTVLNFKNIDTTKQPIFLGEDKEITSRAELIRNNFDKILGDDRDKEQSMSQKEDDCASGACKL